MGDRNCRDPYFQAPLRFQERDFFLGQGWGFRSVDDIDPVCRREAKQIKAVIRDTRRQLKSKTMSAHDARHAREIIARQ
jgi:hypothetical protein